MKRYRNINSDNANVAYSDALGEMSGQMDMNSKDDPDEFSQYNLNKEMSINNEYYGNFPNDLIRPVQRRSKSFDANRDKRYPQTESVNSKAPQSKRVIKKSLL